MMGGVNCEFFLCVFGGLSELGFVGFEDYRIGF